jgi:hypothetical protein
LFLALALNAGASPACDAELAPIQESWRRWQLAEEPGPGREAFLAAWPAVSAECRGAEWYLLAARALGRTPTWSLTAGDLTLHTTREALERALQVEPDHPAVAAFLTFAAGVHADTPPLPAGICQRLPAGDDQRYVCGSVAVAEGRPADAITAFSAITQPGLYPDLGLRWRQADPKAALPPAVSGPPSEATCMAFGATYAECQVVQKAWKKAGR